MIGTEGRYTLDWGRYGSTLLRQWRLLLIVFLVALPIGTGLAWLFPLNYTASMTVTAARYSNDTKPTEGPGTVASLLSPESGQLSDFALYLQMFTSQLVAERIFQDRPALVRSIFRSEWKGDHWEPPQSTRQEIRKFTLGLVGLPAWTPPSPLRLAQFLSSIDVAMDRRSPVATVSLKMRDRQLALDILKALHEESEYILKSAATSRSLLKAQFLGEMAISSRGVDVSQSVAGAQVRNQISAAVSRAPVPFAAEYISPPYASPLPDRSSRTMVPFGFAALMTLLMGSWIMLAEFFPRFRPRFFAH